MVNKFSDRNVLGRRYKWFKPLNNRLLPLPTGGCTLFDAGCHWLPIVVSHACPITQFRSECRPGVLEAYRSVYTVDKPKYNAVAQVEHEANGCRFYIRRAGGRSVSVENLYLKNSYWAFTVAALLRLPLNRWLSAASFLRCLIFTALVSSR